MVLTDATRAKWIPSITQDWGGSTVPSVLSGNELINEMERAYMEGDPSSYHIARSSLESISKQFSSGVAPTFPVSVKTP